MKCTIEDYQRSLCHLQNVRKTLEDDIKKNIREQAKIRDKIRKLEEDKMIKGGT